MKQRTFLLAIFVQLMLTGCVRYRTISTSHCIYENNFLDIKYQYCLVAIGMGSHEDSSVAVENALFHGKRKLLNSYDRELSLLIEALILEDSTLSIDCLYDQAPTLQSDDFQRTESHKVWRREGRFEVYIPMYTSHSTLLRLFESNCIPQKDSIIKGDTFQKLMERVTREQHSLNPPNTEAPPKK